MTTDVKFATTDVSVPDAFTIMSVNRIRHLPIVNEKREILGMVSLRFLMHEQLENLLTELGNMKDYMGYMQADAPPT